MLFQVAQSPISVTRDLPCQLKITLICTCKKLTVDMMCIVDIMKSFPNLHLIYLKIYLFCYICINFLHINFTHFLGCYFPRISYLFDESRIFGLVLVFHKSRLQNLDLWNTKLEQYKTEFMSS